MKGQLPEASVRSQRARDYLELLFNAVGTHLPSHRLRQAWLRALGAQIGDDVALFRGTTVLSPRGLVIGDRCAVGWRCVLDARGGIVLQHDVVLASDVQLITADHDIEDPDFAARLAPIVVEHHAWLATRATVLRGVTVHEGGVVAAGAVVVHDVAQQAVVAGVPARPVAARARVGTYRVGFRPRFY